MVSLIIDSYYDCVITSEWAACAGLKKETLQIVLYFFSAAFWGAADIQDIIDLKREENTISEKLSSSIRFTDRKIINMTNDIHASHEELEGLVENLKNEATIEINQVTRLITQSNEYSSAARKINSKMNKLFSGVESAVNGHLNPDLIPVEELMECVQEIQRKLAMQDEKLTVGLKEPKLYYRYMTPDIKRLGNMISVDIKIPIVSKGRPITLHRINKFGLPIHNSSNDTTMVENIPRLIGTDFESGIYLEIIDDSLQDCFDGGMGKICRVTVKRRKFSDPSCTLAILMSRPEDILDKCDIKYYISPKLAEPEVMFFDDVIMVTKAREMYFLCKNMKARRIEIANSVIFRTPCNCKLQIGSYTYGEFQRNCYNFHANAMMYPINLAYSIHFLNESQFDHTDTFIFPMAKNITTLPYVRIYERIGKDPILSSVGIGMRQIAEAVRQDATIYPTIIDMIMARQINLNYRMSDFKVSLTIADVLLISTAFIPLIAGYIRLKVKQNKKVKGIRYAVEEILDERKYWATDRKSLTANEAVYMDITL